MQYKKQILKTMRQCIFFVVLFRNYIVDKGIIEEFREEEGRKELQSPS